MAQVLNGVELKKQLPGYYNHITFLNFFRYLTEIIL